MKQRRAGSIYPMSTPLTVPDQHCAHCEKQRTLMVALDRGAKTWYLCSKCWLEGLEPWNTPVSDPTIAAPTIGA